MAAMATAAKECIPMMKAVCVLLCLSHFGLLAMADEYVRPGLRPLVRINHGQRPESEPQQVHVNLAGHLRAGVSYVTSKRINAPSIVYYGTQSGVYTWQAEGSYTSYKFVDYSSENIHYVILGVEKPLEPYRKYYYKCGNGSKEYSFTMPPPLGPDVPIKFGLVGDLGQTEWSLSTLHYMQETDMDVVLFAGDLSYADRYQPRWDTWGRVIEPHASSIPWMVVEGNHEVEDMYGLVQDFTSYNARWPMPYKESGSTSNLYYSFEVAGVHMLMLGSYAPHEVGSPQYQWLKNDLARVDRKKTPWLIVILHAPWYNSNWSHQMEGETMRLAVEDLLYDAKVDLLFAGHVHAYERTVPMYQWKADNCGITHIVVGDGGNREGLSRTYMSPAPSWTAKREASFGFGKLDIVNATHAKWLWHRNQDTRVEYGDETWIQTLGDPAHPCYQRSYEEVNDSWNLHPQHLTAEM
eukprot:TRINITY_DN8329_c0_g1_i1.p1 TRINITY_DN8329_c0_g1~~TRINITY_DN8329_c0_g1_i1.p1  ORF type:complete len:465 (-),score=68.58 TRINITY_DN8329_c0_g1_i1:629-2023(-)